MAGRENEGNQRGGEEHLDDGDVTVITAEYPRERVCVVDSEAFRSTYDGKQVNEAEHGVSAQRWTYRQRDSCDPD